jgi:hypothetical protein
MGIIQNYNNGLMDDLRSVTYSETGTVSPYVVKDVKNPNPNPLGLELNKRIDDTSRIAQMLIDKPGLKWIGNQTLLSQAELASKAKAAADGKKTGVGKALAGFAAAAGQVLKIIGSTLAQVPVNGTGTHFVRGFKTDTYLQPAGTNEASGFAQFFGAGGIEGAPLALNGETIIPDNTGQSGYKPSHESNLQASSSIFSNTIITETLDESVSISSLEELNGGTANTERTTTLIDYRKLEGKNYRSNTYTLNYQDPLVNKETRVGLGNQGKKKSYLTNYTDVDIDRIDRVNYSGVLTNRPPEIDFGFDTSDFVQLSFDIITPEDTYFIQFRAFLETFSDTFDADWGKTNYIGRAEDFYTYNGFSRQVNIGFKIAAATRSEMLPIYNKINTLASVTAPTYGGTESKFMRGTIARVTVGDYLYNVPGIIDSVDFSWQTDYSWEINAIKPDGKEDTMPVLPHILDCSLSFKPIHDFVPESGLTTFISNNPKKG